jgi:cytochrome c biogenesis protein CcmG/thiol:disulfide interchange protein DsbE
MSASRQWVLVGAVVTGLGLGGVAMVEFGKDIARVEVGAKAPEFRAYDLASGDTVTLARYRNTVTLVNVWATWCVPCRVEMPAMERLYDALKSRGFKIAAVSIDEGPPEDVRAFGRDLHLTFDLLQDRTRTIEQQYQTTGVPESFLVDRHGVIVKRVIGAQDWSAPVNRALVERLLLDTGR